MTDFVDFLNSNTNEATVSKQHLIYIKSSLIPPRSPIRKQLIADGWTYKNRLTRSSPFTCFVISSSQYDKLYFPSPEEAEDMILINLYFDSDDD